MPASAATARRSPPPGLSPVGRAAVALTLVWLPVLVVTLARIEIDRTPSIEAGQANLRAIWPLWIAAGAVWLGLGGLMISIWRRPVVQTTTTFWQVGVAVLAVAAATRAGVIAWHTPSLSDDVYRYVFDGRNLAAGVNPYLVRPADRVGEAVDRLERPLGVSGSTGRLIDGERWAGEAALVPLINNPELHTIYLPTSQWLFAAAGLVADRAAMSPRASTRMFRGVFAGLDLSVVVMLLGVLRRRGRSAWWAAVYAWHPLPIIEIAGSGHQDSIGIALLVLALFLAGRFPRQLWAWTVALAGAVLVKPVALPAATFLLRARSWRAWLASAAIGAAACLVIATPLWLGQDGQPFSNLRTTATRFSLKWAHFGGVYEPLLHRIEAVTPDATNDDQEMLARRICLVLVAGVWLAMLLTRCDPWTGTRAVLFAMVLLSPTAHPWYMLWPLAVATIAMSPAVWVASLTLLLGYAQLGDVVAWRVPAWLMVVAWVPVYAALAGDGYRRIMVRRATAAAEREGDR